MKHENFITHAFDYKIKITAESFRNYTEKFEKLIELEQNEIRLEYKSILAEIEENKDEYSNDYIMNLESSVIEQYIAIENEIANRFRSSLVIQLYSFLEVELRNFCDLHSYNNDKEYKVNDLKGNNELDKIKKYLKNSALLDVNTIQPLWNFVNDFRKVRNKIVHHDSVINKSDNDYNSILKFSENHFTLRPYVGEDSFSIFFHNKHFLMVSIEMIEMFIRSITTIDE